MATTKTILVIDDNAAVRDMLGEILTREGYAVIAIADAADAFSRLSQDIDLVLLDLVMPQASMDGFAFLSSARARAELVNTPVIVTSGLGEAVLAALAPEVAQTLRIVSVISKPIEISALVAAVRAALGDSDPA